MTLLEAVRTLRLIFPTVGIYDCWRILPKRSTYSTYDLIAVLKQLHKKHLNFQSYASEIGGTIIDSELVNGVQIVHNFKLLHVS